MGDDIWRAASISEKGCEVVTHKLSYEVKNGSERKLILNNITCYARPGELVALMGSSGAGKTSLMNVLAGRVEGGVVSGELLFNGLPSSPMNTPRVAYVLQSDAHLPNLTVRETITYAARLRVSGALSDEDLDDRVNLIVQTLSLGRCVDSRVGGGLVRGISGGEMKRLSIAVELIELPDLIFLDEPTTGLDAELAREVMLSLRNIVSRRRLAFATIHQPSPESFQLIHKVILLERGHLVYFGPTADIVRYFTQSPLCLRQGVLDNPAEFVVAAAAGKLGKVFEQLLLAYESSSLSAENSAYVTSVIQSTLGPGGVTAPTLASAISSPRTLSDASSYHGSELSGRQLGRLDRGARRLRRQAGGGALAQWCTLLHRTLRCKAREKISRLLLSKSVFMAVFFGTLFWQLSDDTLSDVDQRYTVLYYCVLFNMTANFQVVPEVFMDRQVSERERAAGLYGPGTYLLSLFAAYLPIITFMVTAFSGITYFTVDLRHGADHFLYFCALGMMLQFVGLFVGVVLALSMSSPQGAFAVVPFLHSTFFCFTGFLIRPSDVPAMWSWISWTFFGRWGLAGFAVNEFDGSGQWEDDREIDVSSRNGTEYWADTQVLESMDTEGVSRWDAFGIVTAWAAFLFLYAWWLLAKPPGSIWEWVGAAFRVSPPRAHTPVKQAASGVSSGPTLPPKSPDLAATPQSRSPQGSPKSFIKAPVRVNSESHLHDPLLGEMLPMDSDDESFVDEHLQQRDDTTWRESSFREGGCEVVACNLSYQVEGPPARVLLKELFFRVAGGHMCAVMGPSGAGKTTLLNILSGRLDGGTIAGSLLYNGIPRERVFGSGPSTSRGRRALPGVSYVEQMDVLMPTLTVEETIHFAAHMRMSSEYSQEQRIERAELLLRAVDLQRVRGCLVGGGERIRGVSGGERKRVSIAVELIHLPDLLFLDEPTSGLDSRLSYDVMRTVRSLTCRDRTCFVTIHQPSPSVFALFDRVLLLAAGEIVYFGSTKTAPTYFRRVESELPSVTLQQSAVGQEATQAYDIDSDMYHDCESLLSASGSYDNRDSDSRGTMLARSHMAVGEDDENSGLGGELSMSFSLAPQDAPKESHQYRSDADYVVAVASKPGAAKKWRQTDEAAQVLRITQDRAQCCSLSGATYGTSTQSRKPTLAGPNPGVGPQHKRSLRAAKESSPLAPFSRQVWMLTVRYWKGIRRAGLPRVLTIKTLFTGILFATVFYDLDTTEDGARNRISLIFYIMLNHTMTLSQTVPDVCEGRALFYRERSAGAYSSAAYATFLALAYFPIVFISEVCVAAMVYYPTGLRDTTEALAYFFVQAILVQYAGLSMMQTMAAGMPDARAVFASLDIPATLTIYFMGFAPKLPDIPRGWSWAPVISFARYGFAGLVVNEFEERDECWSASGTSTSDDEACVSSDSLLEEYGLEDWDKHVSLIVVGGFIVLFRIAIFALIKWVNWSRK